MRRSRIESNPDWDNNLSPYAASPELRLIWAVVVRAINDAFIVTLNTSDTDRLDAVVWLLGDSKDRPLTFWYCCEAIGLDFEAAKKSIKIALDEKDLTITQARLEGLLRKIHNRGRSWYHYFSNPEIIPS